MSQMCLTFGMIPGSLSDLLGLRLSRPLQSRPAQIYNGSRDHADEVRHCLGNIVIVSCKLIRCQL